MKILIDARTLGTKPSGIGIYIYNMVLALEKVTDYEIVLITDICESEQIKKLKHDYGVRLHIYGQPCAKSLKLIGYLGYVQRMIYEERPDIFWEPNNLSPIPLRNPYGRMWMTVHDVFPITDPKSFDRYYPLFFRYGMSVSMRCFDEIIYNSEQTRRDTEKYFSRARKLKSYVAYMPVQAPDILRKCSHTARKSAMADAANPDKQTDEKRSMQAADEQSNYIARCDAATTDDQPFLYIGNLERRKGTDILLRAYEQYIERGGRRQLRLAGKIREDAIRQQLSDTIKHVGRDKLVYLGYIDERTKQEELASCGTFIFPSRAEGFGIPVIEAMYYDKPIITSNLDIFREITDGAVTMCEENELADAMSAPVRGVDKERYAQITKRYTFESIGRSVAEEILANSCKTETNAAFSR